MMRSLRVAATAVLALYAGSAAAQGKGSSAHPEATERVTLCHKPGTSDEQTLSLPRPAVQAHLGHGDTEGACGEAPVTCGPRPLPAEPPAGELPAEEEADGAWTSEATAQLEGASPAELNAPHTPVGFRLSCPTLQMSEDAVVVYLNGRPQPFSALALAPDRVTLTTGLADGRNVLELVARDAYGFTIESSAVLWAGSYSLPVQVLDEAGAPAAGVTVTARLSDDPGVSASIVTDAAGSGVLMQLANRSYNVVATASGNRFATRPAYVTDGTVVLRLRGFNAPSPIANNDFSLGLEGWDIGSAPVFLISHTEGPMGLTASALAAPAPLMGPADPASRAERARELGDALRSEVMMLAASADTDLVLATSGEGQQSISRTFQVSPGVQSVTVRYRFLTTEVPGGYFGTQYNDFFNVTLRTQNGGGSRNDGNSMNGLGLAAFDGAGAIGWREAELPVGPDGDTVQVDLAVANVADGILDSYVIVDVVEEKKLSISELVLNDIDNARLAYLSASNHTYFGGNTRVHGTLTVKGDAEDSLTELRLEVLEGGAVVATGTLAAGLTGTLYRAFGESGEIQLATSQLLFEIPAAQLAGVNQDTNGNLTLRVQARSQRGETAERDFGAVTKLVRVDTAPRYGGRDTARGGDDWVKPGVRTLVQGTTHTWGDFSNMNAGSFAPDHQTHRTGNSADGWFTNYNVRDAGTAATIIGHLNTHGLRISRVYVTFTPTSAFATAINGVVLNDGRQANQVIRNVGGHGTHFHWEVTEN